MDKMSGCDGGSGLNSGRFLGGKRLECECGLELCELSDEFLTALMDFSTERWGELDRPLLLEQFCWIHQTLFCLENQRGIELISEKQ